MSWLASRTNVSVKADVKQRDVEAARCWGPYRAHPDGSRCPPPDQEPCRSDPKSCGDCDPCFQAPPPDYSAGDLRALPEGDGLLLRSLPPQQLTHTRMMTLLRWWQWGVDSPLTPDGMSVWF